MDFYANYALVGKISATDSKARLVCFKKAHVQMGKVPGTISFMIAPRI